MTVAVLTQRPVQPPQGDWTYEDYLKLPNDGKRYEIIEGVLYVANASDADHQFTVTETSRQLGNFVVPRKLGRVLVAPFEVHLTPRSRPVQPDVLFVSAARWLQGHVAAFEGAPDLVVEVISPSRVRVDRVIKFTAYEAAGVREYWIANPRTRTVEVYVLENGEYGLLGEFAGDERIQSMVLEGIAIVADALFS